MNRPRAFINPGVIEMHFLGGEAETQAEDLLTRIVSEGSSLSPWGAL
jgi:hypothetical protein